MAVGSVLIALQASRPDGSGVTSAEFLGPLDIKPGEVEGARADGGPWASGMVYFSIVRETDFAHVDTASDAGAQSEAFYRTVIDAFRDVGRFLESRPSETTAKMRATGLSMRIFVDVRMDQDQMELELPPEFLAACGRHGLPIYVISNDVPAAEFLANQSR